MADKTGEFWYYCSVPGHREAGMEGRVQVLPGSRGASRATAPDIARDPTDLPPPIHARPSQIIRVDLSTIELKGQLDDKTTYTYWTFNGKVPGPFVRVRVGDTVEVKLKNASDSVMASFGRFSCRHRPWRWRAMTQTDPGNETMVTFTALKAGCLCLSLRHTHGCPPHHQWNVWPHSRRAGGRSAASGPRVLRDAGELYTVRHSVPQGDQEMDYDKLISERPEYFLFNGSVGALTKTHPLDLGRRNGAHLFRCRRPELHLVLSCDRRDI